MKKGRLEVVGKARRRVDGRGKATGQLRFADDLSLPRMLHCKLLRSPHPHALVESIEVSKAARHPGVDGAQLQADLSLLLQQVVFRRAL